MCTWELRQTLADSAAEARRMAVCGETAAWRCAFRARVPAGGVKRASLVFDSAASLPSTGNRALTAEVPPDWPGSICFGFPLHDCAELDKFTSSCCPAGVPQATGARGLALEVWPKHRKATISCWVRANV